MIPKKLPSLKELKTLLDYNPDNGQFVWISGPRKGKIAGHIKFDGYRTIVIKGAHFQAHRLAWVMSGNKIAAQIGHISKNRDDNSISNLTVSSRCLKNTNKSSSRNSKKA
jgi:hypothetical protein